ncbi:MAG: pimeloyl-ACP methyl ester carboxylesterase [Polaribacter sp.]|jgi:pimeloyl-ACP methyl ester carboxylesterase
MSKHNYRIYLTFFSLFFSIWLMKGDCQSHNEFPISGPVQEETGPGGKDYLHDSIAIFDYADKQDGFWLYQPASPTPSAAPVVVFLHGYGAYNPMIYGKWIKHLVKRGNIVIFPRYQKNIFSPPADDFIPNTIVAIKQALIIIDSIHHIDPIVDNFAIAGHSYGGVIAAGMTADYTNYGIPQPKAVLLCSPGSGPFKGGVLDDYSGIPSDTKIVSMVSENDRIVGDKIGVRIFETAVNTPNRNLIRQYEDKHSVSDPVHAGHNECYSLDKDLDNGIRNSTAKRAIRSSEFNTLDYSGYWKIFDALIACSLQGTNCDAALGNTPFQRSLGSWSDGEVIRELEVQVPVVTMKLQFSGLEGGLENR